MNAYYNEWEDYPADWLENLMLMGHIANGKVDRRSIGEVKGSDLESFTRCHFFAGIAGWDIALQLAGRGNDRPVWTGSTSCQPFSAAGKRKGFADDRHLWPEFKRLIAERRPPTIFGEQVAAATDWLRLVRSDLEEMGYAVGCLPIQAASAGADHLRDRFWFVAHRPGERSGRKTGSVCAPYGRQNFRESGESFGASSVLALADKGSGRRTGKNGREEEQPGRTEIERTGGSGNVAHQSSKGSLPGAQQGIHSGEEGAGSRHVESERRGFPYMADNNKGPQGRTLSAECSGEWLVGQDGVANASQQQQHRSGNAGEEGRDEFADGVSSICERRTRTVFGEETQERGENRSQHGHLSHRLEHAGEGGGIDLAFSESNGLQKQPHVQGSRRRSEEERDDQRRLVNSSDTYEWVIGVDGKARRVKSGIRLLAHGVPNRVAKLRAFGNAIDPRPAAEFIKAAMGWIDARK